MKFSFKANSVRENETKLIPSELCLNKVKIPLFERNLFHLIGASQIRKESVSNIPELSIGVSSSSNTSAISPADHDELRYVSNQNSNKRMHLGSSNPNINHTTNVSNDGVGGGVGGLSGSKTPTLGRKYSKRHSTVSSMMSGFSGSTSISPIVIATTTSNSTTIPMNEKQVKLGPCQIQPKGYRLSSMRYGELKLGFIMNKGMFEVEVRVEKSPHRKKLTATKIQ